MLAGPMLARSYGLLGFPVSFSNKETWLDRDLPWMFTCDISGDLRIYGRALPSPCLRVVGKVVVQISLPFLLDTLSLDGT